MQINMKRKIKNAQTHAIIKIDKLNSKSQNVQ